MIVSQTIVTRIYLYTIMVVATMGISPVLPLMAQEDDNLKGTLTIDKKAKIELGIANRNYEKISNIKTTTSPSPIEYTFKDIDLSVPKLDTKIKVVTSKSLELTKLYGNCLKIGFGNYTSTYLEAFLANKRNERYSYGMHAKHLSSQNGPLENSGSGENKVDLFGKYFFKKTTFGATVGYQRNRHNFYGYNQVIAPQANEDTLKQFFHLLHGSIYLTNNASSSKFNYYTDLNFYQFNTFLKAKETELLWNVSSFYRIDDTKRILLDGSVSYTNRSDSSTIERSLVSLKPAFRFDGIDNLMIIAGINLAHANDTISDYPKLHIYPRIQAEYTLFDKKLIAFVNVDGDMQKNTLRTFSMENPFLSSDVALQHTNKTIELNGGVKGGVKGGLTYLFRVSSANYRYLSFFNNSFADTSRLSVLYDSGNTSVLTIGGAVSYELSNAFRLGIKVDAYKYTLSSLPSAWHRPDAMGTLNATYNLNKKMHFNADFYYISGLRGYNFVSNQEQKLKGITDLNLKVDYLLSKSFSAFVEVNNIFSQKYQRYLYYTNRGINVLAGFTYSF